VINDTIKITYEHIIPAKQNNLWKFIKVEDLNVGDVIVDENLSNVIVVSKILVEETVETVSIDIENKDIYFVEGLMAHNNSEKA
jgi:hypothetical protein